AGAGTPRQRHTCAPSCVRNTTLKLLTCILLAWRRVAWVLATPAPGTCGRTLQRPSGPVTWRLTAVSSGRAPTPLACWARPPSSATTWWSRPPATMSRTSSSVWADTGQTAEGDESAGAWIVARPAAEAMSLQGFAVARKFLDHREAEPFVQRPRTVAV